MLLQRKCKCIKGMKIDLEVEYSFIIFCKTHTDLFGLVKKTDNKPSVDGSFLQNFLGSTLYF